MCKTATIRMPATLYNAIQNVAWKDKQSMNAWCIEQLTIAVKEVRIRHEMEREMEAEIRAKERIDETTELVA